MWRGIGFMAAALCAVFASSAAFADSLAEERDNVRWNVAYKEARATACAMSARLEDGSSFDLTVFGDRDVVMARITNPSWRSVVTGSVLRVKAQFSGRSETAFATSEAYSLERTVIFMVDTPFLKRLASETSVSFDLGGSAGAARFDLAEASGAMQALERCVQGRFRASRAAQRFQRLGWSAPAG